MKHEDILLPKNMNEMARLMLYNLLDSLCEDGDFDYNRYAINIYSLGLNLSMYIDITEKINNDATIETDGGEMYIKNPLIDAQDRTRRAVFLILEAFGGSLNSSKRITRVANTNGNEPLLSKFIKNTQKGK